MTPRSLLEDKSLSELREIAATLDLQGYARMRKADLIDLLVESAETDDDESAVDDESADAGSDDMEEAASTDDDTRGGARSRGRRRGRDDNGSGNDNGNDNGNGNDDDRRNRGRPTYEAGEVREGVLDLLPEGYGFLRTSGYLTGKRDVYVSQSYVRRFSLRRGDRVRGPIRANNKGSDKFPAIAEILEVEGIPLEEHQELERPDFDDLTPVGVAEPIELTPEDGSRSLAMLDVLAPLALGHRALVIGPRRSGRTTLLTQVAASVAASDLDVDLVFLMVDARPEAVTAARAAVDGVEIAAATFDRGAEDLVAVAELCLERARRLAERGRDVVVVLDDMTALGRAWDQVGPSGRSNSDSGFGPAKRFFATARRLEEGGSITVVAAATTDTGMTPDQHQAEVLLGAATVEWRLRADLARRRVHPALDVVASASHHEEDLLDANALDAATAVRRALAGADTDAAVAAIESVPEDATVKDVIAAFSDLA